MLQTVSRLLPELPLILLIALATHLVMSFAQTLMHYKLGHNPIGGKFFRNHINFHHAHYSKDHLVSRTYLGDEGNNTPFFFIPVFLVGACTYLVLPVDLFVAQLVACAASFYAHVYFDRTDWSVRRQKRVPRPCVFEVSQGRGLGNSHGGGMQ